DRLGELRSRAVDHVGLKARRLAHLVHAVADDLLRGIVDVVADVVEHASEPVHVVAVERRHERPVDQIDELMRQPVSLVLELLDVAHPLVGPVGEVVQETDEALRDLDGVRSGLVEEVEELALLRNEADPHQETFSYTVSPSDRAGTVVSGWGSISLLSRRIRASCRRASPARPSSSAPRCSTTTESRGSTSRERSSSRRTQTDGCAR